MANYKVKYNVRIGDNTETVEFENYDDFEKYLNYTARMKEYNKRELLFRSNERRLSFAKPSSASGGER